MGLKNISKEVVRLKYNGIEIDLSPDAVVDVRDFNVNNSEVMAIEEALLDKYVSGDEKRARLLEKVKTLSNMTDAQINAEIARLTEVIEGMKADLAPMEKEIADYAAQVLDLTGQIEAKDKRVEQLEGWMDEADPKWRKKVSKDAK